MECHNCSAPVDSHTHLDSEEVKFPANGDFSICLYCGALSEFLDGALIPLSDEVIESIQKDDPETWLDDTECWSTFENWLIQLVSSEAEIDLI